MDKNPTIFKTLDIVKGLRSLKEDKKGGLCKNFQVMAWKGYPGKI